MLLHINFKETISFCLYLLKSLVSRDTWQNITPCDVLLVRHDNNCGYRYDGKAYAQIIDSFGELYINRNLSVKSIATPFSRIIGKQARFSPVCFNRTLLRIYILAKLIKIIKGDEISREWIEFHQTDLWCKILEKAGPKCLIGIQPETFLCRTGKLQNIPVYDLQHGVITNGNRYYGEIYRELIPTEDLPTGFLCWDDQGADPILKWAPNKGLRVLKIGNPWFMRFTKIKPDDLLVNTALAQKNVISDDRQCILVSLQDRITELFPDQVYNRVMLDALEKVILDISDQYYWILRLHPVQLNDIEKEVVLNYLTTTFGIEKTERWLKASWRPLPVILKKVDLHITFSSTVVTEAAWMGIRSGILVKNIGQDLKSEDWFWYERRIGIVEGLSQNPELIKKWIADTLAKGRGESTFKDSEENLNAFIDEIAARKS